MTLALVAIGCAMAPNFNQVASPQLISVSVGLRYGFPGLEPGCVGLGPSDACLMEEDVNVRLWVSNRVEFPRVLQVGDVEFNLNGEEAGMLHSAGDASVFEDAMPRPSPFPGETQGRLYRIHVPIHADALTLRYPSGSWELALLAVPPDPILVGVRTNQRSADDLEKHLSALPSAREAEGLLLLAKLIRRDGGDPARTTQLVYQAIEADNRNRQFANKRVDQTFLIAHLRDEGGAPGKDEGVISRFRGALRFCGSKLPFSLLSGGGGARRR